MKLGLIGVGPWGMTLARKFKAQGHEIALHSREKNESVPGLGALVPWQNMRRKVDAVIVASPAHASKKMIFDIVGWGVPVLVTKPLLGAEDLQCSVAIDSPLIMVDYVHLHSPLFKKIEKRVRDGKEISDLECEFYGKGPVRGFPALLDYGPHPLSVAFSLVNTPMIHLKKVTRTSTGEGMEFYIVHADMDGVQVRLRFGNDAPTKVSRITVKFADGNLAFYQDRYPNASYEATDEPTIAVDNHDPLGLLVNKFSRLAEERGEEAEEETQMQLEMAADVEDVLTKIQRAASSSR